MFLGLTDQLRSAMLVDDWLMATTDSDMSALCCYSTRRVVILRPVTQIRRDM